LVCRCLCCNLTYIYSDISLRIELPDHIAVLLLLFWGASILSSIGVILIYILTNSVWSFLFPHIFTKLCYCFCSFYFLKIFIHLLTYEYIVWAISPLLSPTLFLSLPGRTSYHVLGFLLIPTPHVCALPLACDPSPTTLLHLP
jgi:hypothetical protein